MARCSFDMPEDFLLKVSTLAEKTDEIVPKVLKAGAEVVLSKVKTNLQAVVGKDTKYESKSTGELVDALGVSPAKLDKSGNFNVKIGFSEPRKGGEGKTNTVSNAMLANIIEYGKNGQPAKPFLTPAKSASKKNCIEAMKSTLESELKNI